VANGSFPPPIQHVAAPLHVCSMRAPLQRSQLAQLQSANNVELSRFTFVADLSLKTLQISSCSHPSRSSLTVSLVQLFELYLPPM